MISVSALENRGLDDAWTQIATYKKATTASGEWVAKRRTQQIRWMWAMVDDRLIQRLKANAKVKALIPTLEINIAEGRITPSLAVEQLFKAFGV